MEGPGGLQSMGPLGVGHNWATSLSRTGEGNGNPLHCSCLENPRDGRAWWAAVYGVAQSQTRLKQLSSSSSMQSFPIGRSNQFCFVGGEPRRGSRWVWSLTDRKIKRWHEMKNFWELIFEMCLPPRWVTGCSGTEKGKRFTFHFISGSTSEFCICISNLPRVLQQGRVTAS